jgi:hypothetical protein
VPKLTSTTRRAAASSVRTQAVRLVTVASWGVEGGATVVICRRGTHPG